MIFFDNFFILFSNYHHNRVSNYLKKLNLKELIDVGAHKGEFLSYVIKINSIKKFYAFEPQSKIFNILRKNFSKNRKIKLGICGEHGGDPKSIYFCSMVGLNYVSCSPYRVPIARLAAAQAELLKR